MDIYLVCEKQGKRNVEIVNIVYGEDIEEVRKKHPSMIVIKIYGMDIDRIETMRKRIENT